MSEEKKDLNKVEKPIDNGQSEKKEISKEDETSKNEEVKNEEELANKLVEELKEELKKEKEEHSKTQEDRDNYREGLLVSKAKKFSLDDEEEKEIEVKPVDANEVEAGNVDVKTIVDDQIDARSKKEVKQNEQIAIKKFIMAHPDVTDAVFMGVKEEYSNRHGKSVDGITLDLERSLKLYKIDHNIPLQTEKETQPAAELASTPVGAGGAPSTIPKFTEEESKIMADMDIKPELWTQFKKEVLEGTRSVPQEVVDLLKKS